MCLYVIRVPAMPCLLAFHTAINAPFAPESTADDCVVRITIGERWEMSDRIADRQVQTLTAEEERFGQAV